MSDNQKKRVHTTFRLDETKLKDFKVILVKRGESAQTVIEQMITAYIEKNKEYL